MRSAPKRQITGNIMDSSGLKYIELVLIDELHRL